MTLDAFARLLGGTAVTVQVTLAAGLVALAIAFPVGLARLSPWRPLRWAAGAYVEFFRGTSLVVQLFWLYFVLPQFGLTLPAMASAVMAIGLNYGAYGAEIVRGVVASISGGQREAARALGLGRGVTMAKVILPQAAVIMMRPWSNLLIQLLKATSLVSLITVSDLTYRAYQLNQLTMQVGAIFGVVLAIYFLLAQAIGWMGLWGERRFGRWRHGHGAGA